MNDEEIMRKFNEAFSEQPMNANNNQSEDIAPYRATTNLNTVNNVVNNVPNTNVSNVQPTEKLEIQDLLSSDKSVYSSYPYSDTENTSNNQYQSNVNYNYVATNASAKPKKATVKLSQENLIFLAIIAILFIFIMFIPIIYDIIRKIKMI